MSKSYKKHPILKVLDQDFKKLSNKKVRRTKDLPNGGAYRKNGMSWDICDQSSRCTFKEWMDKAWNYYLHNSYLNGRKKKTPPPNKKEELEIWKDCYLRK
jgi:hypothetical protein